MTRHLGLGALLLATLTAACGSSVVAPGNGGNGGGGGWGGGPPICAAEAFPCCEPGYDNPCCADCTPPTAVCGGFAGAVCASDEYCDFPDDHCGSADSTGVCVKRPQGCPKNYQPTCGCDGAIHGNSCETASAGTDVSSFGGCKPPPDMFGCGPFFCTIGAEYCEDSYSDIGNEPPTFTCKPLPSSCAGAPDCACLAGVACGFNCAATFDGGLTVSCGGV